MITIYLIQIATRVSNRLLPHDLSSSMAERELHAYEIHVNHHSILYLSRQIVIPYSSARTPRAWGRESGIFLRAKAFNCVCKSDPRRRRQQEVVCRNANDANLLVDNRSSGERANSNDDDFVLFRTFRWFVRRHNLIIRCLEW